MEQWTVSKAAHDHETFSVLGRRLPQSEKSRRVAWLVEDAFATGLSKPISPRCRLGFGRQPAQRPWSPP